MSTTLTRAPGEAGNPFYQRCNNDYGGHTFLYSRRIGRQPQLGVPGTTTAFADVPGQTTIAGAAKVTGKTGPWTLGSFAPAPCGCRTRRSSSRWCSCAAR